ncbi:hypothetical protein GQ457_01G046030 [Hibiscus cannabinus]
MAMANLCVIFRLKHWEILKWTIFELLYLSDILLVWYTLSTTREVTFTTSGLLSFYGCLADDKYKNKMCGDVVDRKIFGFPIFLEM